ncbi:MAG TPA: pyruvate dehydrogenase (acetyl-transferring) E1 component subunit alpha [Methylomirabilota bacterium]|jgi:pyruvate dehydrogenase E1 component alpha subunit|nr:pyruvate dehydrogenase (acetyl-transferring) E1 component subunit alpha [Methylomirabilota bacterium]
MAKTMPQAKATGASPDPALAKKLLSQMLLIRRFEEKAAEAYALGKIGGFLHLYIGEEAVAVGATSVLRPDDYVISAYREHGHCLAKGADPKRMMAELFGRRDGLSKGKGGSMHLFDKSVNFLGGHAIVGAHLPVAAGVAFAIKYEERDQVIVCYFGDGAVPQGEFHESLNLAALWKLPVVYLCENNRYAMGTSIERALAQTQIWKFGETYGIPAEKVDGMDVLAVREVVARAVERARRDKTPSLIEADTYRFRGHSMRDPAGAVYRTKEEVEREKERDPITLFRERVLRSGALSEADVRAIEKDVNDRMDEAVAFADASPEPPAEWLFTDIYKEA